MIGIQKQPEVQPIPSAHDPTALAGDIGTDYRNVGRNVLRGPAQSNLFAGTAMLLERK